MQSLSIKKIKMKTTKEKVLAFLVDLPKTPEEQFNKGFELYRGSHAKSLSQERFLNQAGYSPSTLATIIYELKKIHGITDSTVRRELLNKTTTEIQSPDPNAGNTPDTTGSPDNTGNPSGDKASSQNETGNKSPNPETGNTSDTTGSQGNNQETNINIKSAFEQSPDTVKEVIKFRDAFPFLNDTNIPEELKILVTDKFSHYYAFAKAHEELFAKVVIPEMLEKSEEEIEKLRQEEIFSLAKAAVINFQADQSIYDELQHYKETGELLKKHPIFEDRNLKDSVEKLTTPEAVKRKSNLENYIRRGVKNASEAKTPEEKQKLELKVESWKKELALINQKLNINEK